MSTNRLQSLDILRGIAIVMVLSHHAITYGDILPSEPWFRALYHFLDLLQTGVPLFFVISGFCIHLRWAKAAQVSGDTSNLKINFFTFWKRRVWRLYPPYFVALCGSMMLLLVALLLGRSVALLEAYPEPKGLWMTYDFIAHLTMLHGLHPVFDKGGGNSVFWSLAREEYFYALYFIFLIFRRRIGIIQTNLAIFLLSIGFPIFMSYFISQSSSWWAIIISSAISLWFQWTLGTIAVEGYLGIIKLPEFTSNGLMSIFWGIVAYFNGIYFHIWFLDSIFWGLCFFTLLNYCVKKEKTELGRELFSNSQLGRFLANVGIWSYSLYLVHLPAQRILKQLLGSFAATQNPFLYFFIVFLLIIAGFFAGRIFFSLVERHFLNHPA